MTTEAGSVTVNVNGKDVGLAALLTRLEAAMAKADAAGQGLGRTTGGPLVTAEQKAANASLSLAQAYARLAQAEGNTAAGVSILNQALAANVGATQRATLSVQTQAASMERGGTLATQFGQAMSSSFLGIIGPAALAGAAIGALSQTGELVELGAQAEQTRLRFDLLARSAGTTGQALLTALRAASAGTISDLNLELAANRANLLGVADSAEKLAPLMQIARDRAQSMGITTTQAFNDLITGLGRGSALILDNLGITVSVTEANKTYAAQLGITASKLTEAQQKQALINEVLRQGQASLAASGGAAETNAAKMERFAAQGENIKANYGASLLGTISPIIDLLGKAGTLATQTGDGASAGAAGVQQFKQSFTDSVPVIGQVLAGLREVNVLLGGTGTSAPPAAAGISATGQAAAAAIPPTQQLAAEQTRLAGAMVVSTGAASPYTAAVVEASNADAAHATVLAFRRSEQEGSVASSNDLTSALGILNAATGDAVVQTTLARAASQTLAAQHDILMAAALNAAGGMLSAKDAAAILAGQFPVTASEAEGLIGKLRVLATLQNTLAVGRGTRPIGAQGVGGFLKDEADVVDKKVKNVFDNLAKGARQVTNFANAPLRSRASGGGGGAGAAKLSDQTKLNNQMLANQNTFDNKEEDAARAHEQKLLDIEADFQKRSLEQQRENEVSKRTSRADFYDSLTSSTKDVGQQVAQTLSAAYEQAYAEAQAIAAGGNAKLAADYLALKQKQIGAELDFQKKLAEATKNKDTGEVARLNAIHKLRQDADAEEEKNLRAGGDTNVNQKQEALDNEAKSFDEQQNKIQTASDRKSTAIVTNAQREGKAISDVNKLLDDQAVKTDRIGGRAAGPGATPGSPPAAAAAAAASAATPAAGIGDLLGALNSVQGLLTGIRSAIEDDTRTVSNAIRSTASARAVS